MTGGEAPELSVVVPVRNEADNILPLLREIHFVLKTRMPFEVIYVDDGSTDSTPEVLTQARKLYSRLVVVRHADPCGQSQAIATGIRAARAPLIATLDGDGQNDPADLPAMLERWRAASDAIRPRLMVTGWRARRQDAPVRRLASMVANAVRARLLGDGVADSGSGIKLLSRSLFLDLPHFDHMHRFMAALVIRAGGTVETIRVNHRPRERGQSKYGVFDRLWVGIVDLLGVMWLMRRSSLPKVEKPE